MECFSRSREGEEGGREELEGRAEGEGEGGLRFQTEERDGMPSSERLFGRADEGWDVYL